MHSVDNSNGIGPTKNHNKVERQPELHFIPFQLFPLFFRRVALIQAKQLVHDGHGSIDYGDEREGVGLYEEEGSYGEDCQEVVRNAGLEEAVLAENVDGVAGEVLFELLSYDVHHFYLQLLNNVGLLIKRFIWQRKKIEQ